jgi:glycosyltransferase involved in cell wall biosynthesis
MQSTGRSLDIVIPLFNEGFTLPELMTRLDSVFSPGRTESLGLRTVRFLFIDDGSTDDTPTILATRIRSGWPATLVRLSRNFGHQPAITAGLDRAEADLVGIMDGDLQDPPELIPEMLAKMGDRFDVVYAVRRSRQEPFYKKAAYWCFYRLFALLCDVRMPVDSGDFCLMRQSVVQALRALPEKLRFHRGLRSWVGFRHTSFFYDRPGRALGRSKYTFAALYALATNGIASLSIRPLRITQAILFFSMLMTIVFVAVIIFAVMRSSAESPLESWFLVTFGLVAFTSCLQIFCLYLLGAYLGRMYIEVKSRPAYLVMETIDPSSENPT